MSSCTEAKPSQPAEPVARCRLKARSRDAEKEHHQPTHRPFAKRHELNQPASFHDKKASNDPLARIVSALSNVGEAFFTGQRRNG